MEKFGKRRWYAFTKMQTRVAQRMPRILSVSENSKQDISADKGVDLDKIHVVPVGVDPDLFLPVPASSAALATSSPRHRPTSR